MTIDYRQFIKNIGKINLVDICSDWQWLLKGLYTPIIATLSGDMFLTDKEGSISWLDTGTGQLTKVAKSSAEFFAALEDIDNVDKWLLASTILDLIENGVSLKENEVYSYKIMPILSGTYSFTNFDATDISVHFSLTGQICRQIQDLPSGPEINKVTLAHDYLNFVNKEK